MFWSGLGEQPTVQMTESRYCFQSYTYVCYLVSNASMLSYTEALLCFNGTHLIAAITFQRGIDVGLCRGTSFF